MRQSLFLMLQLTHGAYILSVLPEILSVKHAVTQLNGNAGRHHAERHATTSAIRIHDFQNAAVRITTLSQISMDGAVIFKVSGLVFIYVNESARPAAGAGAAIRSAGNCTARAIYHQV
jgi:hypothetical protein